MVVWFVIFKKNLIIFDICKYIFCFFGVVFNVIDLWIDYVEK